MLAGRDITLVMQTHKEKRGCNAEEKHREGPRKQNKRNKTNHSEWGDQEAGGKPGEGDLLS